MTERLSRLEEEVRGLKVLVEDLAQRLERVERRAAAQPEVAPPREAADEGSPAGLRLEDALPAGSLDAAGHHLRGLPALLGRTVLVFAGAFLLRALTDAQVVTRPMGVALGLAYAGFWMYASYREDARTAWPSSAIHGLTAVLIGFPLVWETTVRFHVWTPAAAAGILAVLTAAGFLVAWRRHLRPVAWVTALGAAATSLALLLGTRVVAPFATLLIVIGLVSVWISYLKKWYGFRWVTAAFADLVILQTSFLASAPGGPPEQYAPLPPGVATALAMALFIGYLATFTARTLARRRQVTPFEMIQLPLTLLIGVGGAIRIVRAAHRGETVLGALILILALACYGVAFTAVDRRLGRRRNFILYSSLGVALLLAGSLVLSAGGLLPFLWSGLALVAAILGGRFDRVTLRAHGAIYTAAALTVSGALANVRDAFAASLDTSWAPLSTPGLLVLAVTMLCYGVLVWSGGPEEVRWNARIPRLMLAALGLSGVLALVVLAAHRLGIVGSEASLAAVRTVALSVAGVLTALLGRSARTRELGWMSYPLLFLCGAKILTEDLRHGTPLSLFEGLAAYGLALLAVPRLLGRRHGGRTGDTEEVNARSGES